MSDPLVADVHLSRDSIHVQADSAFSREFLRDDFHATYDVADDLSNLGEGLALVPFVANVAPIVWLAGLDLRVPVLDATFADALDETRKVFANMYPSLRWDGSVTPDRTEITTGEEQVATLFSGGVDAIYSSLATEGEQLLGTIQGADIALGNTDGWTAVRNQAATFSSDRGHRNAFIRSNFRQFLNVKVLERRWPEIDGWWNGVQHGIGLLSLMAPIVPAGRVVIAASHTPDFSGKAWGSNPRLDTSIRWGQANVDHHGFDATRQDKIQAIVDAGEPFPQLRVCFSNHYGAGGNCGRCEKCLRTFAGLVAAGADPQNYGFDMSIETGMRTIRRRFAMYRVAFSITKTWHWSMIQQAVVDRSTRLDSHTDSQQGTFLRWLVDFDFARYERRWKLLLAPRKQLIRTLKRFPSVERAARSAMYRSRS